jgi:hypothetical protein
LSWNFCRPALFTAEGAGAPNPPRRCWIERRPRKTFVDHRWPKRAIMVEHRNVHRSGALPCMIRFVRCIDNTLATDVLVVGKIYEVMYVNARDGYYALAGRGQFTMARFRPVSAAEAGYA